MAQISVPNIPGSNGLRADQNTDGSLAFRSSLEIGGNAVSASNAVPVTPVAQAMASVVSTVLESGRVLKGSAGTLFALQARATIGGWIMLFDSASIPADGAVQPRKLWQLSGNDDQRVDISFSPPLAFSNGISVAFSTTGPLTKTAAADAWFSAKVA
jgi:hypothetical protein